MRPVLIAAALAVLLASPPAFAQQACDRRERVVELLAAKYEEKPVAVGITAQGALVEVLARPSGATWTLIVTSPQGISCVLLAGQGWKQLEQTAREPGA